MKTIKEFFEKLDSPHKEKAMKNLKFPEQQQPTIYLALSYGFDWRTSPEGYEYWNDVYKELMNKRYTVNNQIVTKPTEQNETKETVQVEEKIENLENKTDSEENLSLENKITPNSLVNMYQTQKKLDEVSEDFFDFEEKKEIEKKISYEENKRMV